MQIVSYKSIKELTFQKFFKYHRRMSDDLNPIEKRILVARTWEKRIKTLLEKRRKKDPDYSEARFCRKHGFDPAFFSRNKKLRTIPKQETVDLVEAALEKEGV